MVYYIPGMESDERFDLILQTTKIDSPDMITAMRKHVVYGLTITRAACSPHVDESNLRRALKSFNDGLTIIEKVKELDYAKFQTFSS